MDVEMMFARGKDAADRGNYDYAIAIFRDILREHPNHLNARIAMRGCQLQKFQERGGGLAAKASGIINGLGSLLMMTIFASKPEKVVEHCENFLARYPTFVPVLFRLAYAFRRLGHIDAAVNTLEFARQRNPQNTKVLWHLAELYEEQKDYKRAVRCWEEYLKLHPTDQIALKRMKDVSAVFHLQASGLEESESYREQIRDEQKAMELEKEQRIVRSDEEIEQAIAELQKRLKEAPDDHVALTRLGDLYQRKERLKFALQAYEKAYQISKRYQVREKIGDIQIKILRQAEEKAAAEAQANPQNADAQKKAKAAREERINFCVQELKFRSDSHPTDLKVAHELGEYLYEAGVERNDPEIIRQAITQFQKAVSDPRLRVRAHFMLGRCFARDPKTRDMAIAQYKRAMEHVLTPQSDLAKEITYSIAELHELQGQPKEALDWYKKVFEVDAAYRDVAEKIDKLAREVFV